MSQRLRIRKFLFFLINLFWDQKSISNLEALTVSVKVTLTTVVWKIDVKNRQMRHPLEESRRTYWSKMVNETEKKSIDWITLHLKYYFYKFYKGLRFNFKKKLMIHINKVSLSSKNLFNINFYFMFTFGDRLDS